MILFHNVHFKVKALVFTIVMSLLSLITALSVEALTITRGPYLQLSTEKSVVIRWRTDDDVISRVRYWKAGTTTKTTIKNSSSLMIQGEKVDSPSNFTTDTANISSRKRTKSILRWSPPLWTNIGAHGPAQRTINAAGNDISEIIEEIIDDTGWVQGGNMAFIITGSGERIAKSHNSIGGGEPLLHIEYNNGSGVPQPPINIAVSQGNDDAEEFVINRDVSLTSSDLELGTEADRSRSQQMGIIFRNINLPTNATITKAYIEFTVKEKNIKLKEHEITITGLDPDAKYFYEILDDSNPGTTIVGGEPDYYFRTHPVKGTAKATRIWVLGDSGQGGLEAILSPGPTPVPNAGASARVVRDRYYEWNGNNNPPEPGDEHADIVLMLGDNAYNNGREEEYQHAIFANMYEDILRNSVLWPVIGNHEVSFESVTFTNSILQSGVYYDTFTLPRAGQAGGAVSGTEAYYSFDFGNIHFVCLESLAHTPPASSFAIGMREWLEDDLSSIDQGQKWIIATWHHPPYSWGSHNTDNISETQSRNMREKVLEILEEYGVDMVLTGHSHSYERSMLIHGHYGVSDTFAKSKMAIDHGNGIESGSDGAYIKSGTDGIVYTVAGSASKISNTFFREGPIPPRRFHPVMVESMKRLGSVVLDVNVNGKRIESYFIDNNGQELDHFVLEKPDVVFTAFNDLSNGESPCPENTKITYYTTDVGAGHPCGNSGKLKNYDTPGGSDTPVTLTVTGGNWNSFAATLGALSNTGTDAYRVFDGKLNATGVIAYSNNPIVLTFSGMGSSLRYEVVVFGNRNVSGYTNRVSKIRIDGAGNSNNNFKNKSTFKATYSNADDPETIIVNGFNREEGYVARFTDIDPGGDGVITITISDGGSEFPSKQYVNAVMLKALD